MIKCFFHYFCCEGIEDPDLDRDEENGMLDQHSPVQDIAVFSESEVEEIDEMLFDPPPMFAR